jgi:hypothetical protein
MKKVFLVLLTSFVFLLLLGCNGLWVQFEYTPTPDHLLFSRYDQLLHEQYYYYIGPVTLADYSNDLLINFELKTWDGDYGIELLFMTEANFEDFKGGGTYSAYHKTFYYKGSYTWDLSDIPPGVYYFIIDNSDKGWEFTDADLEDDIAIFDIEGYEY